MTHRRSGSWRGVLFIGALTVAFLFLGCDALLDSGSSSSDGVSVPSANAPSSVSTANFADGFSDDVTAVTAEEAEDLVLGLLGGNGGVNGLSVGTLSSSGVRAQSENGENDEEDELDFLLELLGEYLDIYYGDDFFNADSIQSEFTLDLGEFADNDDELQGTLDVSDFSLRIRESHRETDTTHRFTLSLRSAITVDIDDLAFVDNDEGEGEEDKTIIGVPNGRISFAANAEADERYNIDTDRVSIDYALSLDAGIALTVENRTEDKGAHFLITVNGGDRNSERNITYYELEDTIGERLLSRMNLRLRVYGNPNDDPLLDWDLEDLIAAIDAIDDNVD